MGVESPTLQYRIAQDGFEVVDLGVSILPKDQAAIVTRGNESQRVPLKTTTCLLKRNDVMVGGIEVAVEVDVPFEQALSVPLFYIANYSFFGLPTPDLHPVISEKTIRPDRTVTRVPDSGLLQQTINATTVLKASLYCQQRTRVK